MSAIPHDYREVFSRLKRPKWKSSQNQWEACCPAHDDQHASLTVKVAEDRLLVKCHAGQACSFEAIRQALGLDSQAFFAPKDRNMSGRKLVATYDYRDEQGELLFQAVRYEPKGFSQRRPAIDPPKGAEPWVWNLGETRRVLYKLPELLRASPKMPVFVAEGERDVETLMHLGLVATCNSGGAGKWIDDYAEPLKGRRVVILVDNDKPGIDHGLKVAHMLAAHVAELRFVLLPGLEDKEDVTDWLAKGHTKQELIEFVKSCPDIREAAQKVAADELLAASAPREPEQPADDSAGVPDPDNDATATPGIEPPDIDAHRPLAECATDETRLDADWQQQRNRLAMQSTLDRINAAAHLEPAHWLIVARRELAMLEHEVGSSLEHAG